MDSLISTPSPSYGERPPGSTINTLVLHYTGMKTAKAALDRLCDPKVEVSAHYIIDETGVIYQLVADEKRAWHAGIGYWRGMTNINDVSIGIELVNPGHEFGYRPFPAAQIEALIPLCQQLIHTHNIPACNIIGHSDIAPLRKEDPGELFDWRLLAAHGIGLCPEPSLASDDSLSLLLDRSGLLSLQQRLADFGYKITQNGEYDKETEAVIRAFKRHFCPSLLNSHWDRGAEKMLQALEGIK